MSEKITSSPAFRWICIIVFAIIISYSLSCIRYKRNWFLGYSVNDAEYIWSSGFESRFDFGENTIASIIGIISGPADYVRLELINDLPANQKSINESGLLEFNRQIGYSGYVSVSVIRSKETIFIAGKSPMVSDAYIMGADGVIRKISSK